jgi:hypothetical protein
MLNFDQSGPPKRSPSLGMPWIWLSVVCLLFTSCSKEQVDNLTSKVKEQVSKAPDVVKEVLPSTGSIALQFEKPIDLKQANGDLFVLKGRPSVLQIRSYARKERGKLPAVFFHATTDATSVDQLIGKSVDGTLFVQFDNGADIWKNPEESPTTVLIESVEKSELVCRVVGGMLYSVGGGKSPVTGEIRAIITSPAP